MINIIFIKKKNIYNVNKLKKKNYFLQMKCIIKSFCACDLEIFTALLSVLQVIIYRPSTG